MISMFTCTARGVRSTVDSIATPCSANAYGRYFRWRLRPASKVTDCDLRQSRLGFGQLEHEIAREPLGIPPNSLVQHLGRDSVENRQIAIQQDLVAPEQDDHPLDGLRGHDVLVRHCA